ncbi:MAG: hypothetical protein ABFS14_13195 [Gemmatimonadota bacterium]
MNERGAAESMRDAAYGLKMGERPDNPQCGSAPFPDSRSVYWTPRGSGPAGPGSAASGGLYEVVFTQTVLRQVKEHVGRGGKEARFGFLLGELYRCPKSSMQYVVIDTGIPSDEPFSEDAPGRCLESAWSAVRERASRHSGVLVGWYHSHHLLGPDESEADQDAGQHYFAEAWQCGLIIVPDHRDPKGGVYRPAGTGDDKNSPAPFYELLDESAGRGRAHTVLDWANYEADRDTEFERVVPDEIPPVPGPASGPGLVLTGDSEDRMFPRVSRMFPRLGNVKREDVRYAGLVVLLLGALAVALMSVRSALRGPEPDIEPAVSVPVTAPTGPFFQHAGSLDQAMERYGERASDFDLGRIGCDFLTTGYSATDDAFVAMTAEYANLAERSGTREQAIYDRLVSEMNTVNRHFDGSGCPRPSE